MAPGFPYHDMPHKHPFHAGFPGNEPLEAPFPPVTNSTQNYIIGNSGCRWLPRVPLVCRRRVLEPTPIEHKPEGLCARPDLPLLKFSRVGTLGRRCSIVFCGDFSS